VTQTIYIQQYDNGLTLVAERMDWLESVAVTLNVAGGFSHDPPDKLGLTNLTCELLQRGCGQRSSREFVESLENLGVDFSASVSAVHTVFGAAMVWDKLSPAMEILADVVRRPHIPSDQLDDARMVCLHEIRSLDDDFSQRTLQELRAKTYGDPWGRCSQGTQDYIERATLEDVQQHFAGTYGAGKAILSVAGKFEWQELETLVRRHFADWREVDLPRPAETSPEPGYLHFPQDTNQTHIGLAFPSVCYRDPDFFQARGAVGVLSDGVSSRLFNEVREKRGLCYTVNAYCHSYYDRGRIIGYAGTTTERAQETLDVFLAEIERLQEGIQADELERVQARIKSALIMQQESSGSRSSAIAGDWYYWNRVRLIGELKGIINSLTCDSINAYLSAHPPRDVTVVTLGAKPLEIPLGVSASYPA
jgi:predicted Zn-dependent peptidase